MHATLPGLIAARTREAPDAPALLGVPGAPLSYGETARFMRRCGARLAALGIGRGDRVALVVENGVEAALAFLGVAGAAVAAPLNPAFSREEFAFTLRDLRARLMIADAGATPAAAAAAAALGIPVVALPDPRVGAELPVRAEPARPEDVALVLHTSGTTSRPKIVPLTQANLAASAANIAASLGLTPADRCLNVMPLFHIHGLVGAVLASLHAGASVACAPGFDGARFLAWVGDAAPTWYTAVPTMHQAVLGALHAGAGLPKGARLRFARSCSSALPPRLMRELEAALGVPVVEAYGMTEAAHQMACNPLPPRERKPGSVGRPTGVEIGVVDGAGRQLAPGETGEIVVRGTNVTAGYESPPGANAAAFFDGWFRTGDEGRIDGDGYLFLTGRLKEIVNRGGEKISPREVDEALLEHPAVAQAVAFAVPHATLGEDLAAAVVLHPRRAATPAELREHAFGRLAAFKVPSAIVIVESIPKGPTGKVQRLGLAGQLRDRLAAGFLPPRDEVEAVVADTWCEVLGLERVGVRDNFFALGGDSLRGTRVVARINELFLTGLRVTSLFRHPEIEPFAQEVRESADPARLEAVMHAFDELDHAADEDAGRLVGGPDERA